jgi:isoleucyl-tRNA synthetase
MSLYARASNFDISQSPAQVSRPIMDRWILSELQLLIKEVDQAYANFDSQSAGRLLATFIDDLSNWYVRRSRRRFWDGDPAALATLHECIKNLTQLMSPMVPFITEHVWQELIKPVEIGAATSIHLTSWPNADEKLIDLKLGEQVALTRRVVELGRAARAESSVKIRQPLGRALIAASGWANLPADMSDQIADELNVLELEDIASASGDLVSVSVKANFRSLGAKYGGAVQEVAKLIASADAAQLVAKVRNSGSANLGNFEIAIDDLVITEQPKSGWSVASNNGESVALDLTLTEALVNAGNVREVIRALQEGRKSAGFDISDRIVVSWNATSEVVPAVLESLEHIKREVLAIKMEQDQSLLCDTELGFTFTVTRA